MKRYFCPCLVFSCYYAQCLPRTFLIMVIPYCLPYKMAQPWLKLPQLHTVTRGANYKIGALLKLVCICDQSSIQFKQGMKRRSQVNLVFQKMNFGMNWNAYLETVGTKCSTSQEKSQQGAGAGAGAWAGAGRGKTRRMQGRLWRGVGSCLSSPASPARCSSLKSTGFYCTSCSIPVSPVSYDFWELALNSEPLEF